jgi:hypothetical protein
MNDIEVLCHDLKAHRLAHQTITSANALDQAIHAAVEALNLERHGRSVGQATNLGLGATRAGQRQASRTRRSLRHHQRPPDR